MMKGKRKFRPLTSKGVCLVYELLVSNNLVAFPVTDQALKKIEAIVFNVTKLHFGHDIYKTPEEKAVAYLYFLIKDHPFTDGNKRTASLVFEVVCDLNNLRPHYAGLSLDIWAVYVEKIHEEDHQKVIGRLAEEIF